MNNSPNYEPSSLALSQREETIVQTALELLSVVPLVGSAGPAISRIFEARKEKLRDALICALACGRLTERDVIREDDLASFIIRLHRAAMEGCAINKLKMMSDYFFGSCFESTYVEDDFLVMASNIEQLSQDELKALVLIERSIKNGMLVRPRHQQNGAEATCVFHRETIDVADFFDDFLDFREAVIPLLRFGFVDLSSGFGASNPCATETLFDFLAEVNVGKFR